MYKKQADTSVLADPSILPVPETTLQSRFANEVLPSLRQQEEILHDCWQTLMRLKKEV